MHKLARLTFLRALISGLCMCAILYIFDYIEQL